MSFICAGIVALFVFNGVAFWLSQRYDNELFFSEHGYNHPVHAVASRFILDNESSLPTWASSGLLFFAAILLAMIALDSARRHDRLKWFWWGLAIIFLCFSMDETATFHEMAINPLRRRFDLHGLFFFSWVIPAIGCLAVFGLIYLRFLYRVDRRTRILFIAAGMVFVTGALGLEMLGGMIFENIGLNRSALGYFVITTAEELLELVGVTMFIFALLDYIARNDICVAFRYHDAQE